MSTRTSSIKKNQKESLLKREISALLQQASMDYPDLFGLSVSHVTLSDDKGVCSIFFYSPEGKDIFEQKFDTLLLFKKSLRQALARRIPGRYVPELIFKYDEQLEKQLAIERLLDQIKEDS